MLRVKNKLTILHDDNAVFSEYSNDLLDYDRDSVSVTIDANDDYIYIGYYKPIHNIYVEMATGNTNGGSLSTQYHNGTSWVSVSGHMDETKAFTRSGFIVWDANQEDEAEVEVNSNIQFWYRLRPSITTSAVSIQGLNIVFADDQDLKREYYEISQFLPDSVSSHILTHVASRDELIQELRNGGQYKQQDDGRVKDIDAFDLLTLGQINQAATYLALSRIFSNVEDDVDGLYMTKSKHYRSLYNTAMNTFYLDLDKDDDGKLDYSEELASSTTRLLRR
jgi:hypothetical protein